MLFIVLTLLLLHLFSGFAHGVDVTANPSLDISLENAPTQLDRLALLPQDSDWLFDFKGS